MGSDPYFQTADDRKIAALEQQIREAPAACALILEHLKSGLAMIDSLVRLVSHGGPTIAEARAWLDVVDRECLSKESNSGAPLLARLQAADELAVYATHKPSCPKLTMERGHNCDCGYTEALAKFEKLREAK